MALVVADTSALVSLGTVMNGPKRPVVARLNEQQVVISDQVGSALQETASFNDNAANAAHAVLGRSRIETRTTDLDDHFPLNDGETAALTLARDPNTGSGIILWPPDLFLTRSPNGVVTRSTVGCIREED